jgi:hypothetical protein
MSKIKWEEKGKRFYENGVSAGVLYPMSDTAGVYAKDVAWNGLTGVTESPEGAEPTALYADNVKYLTLLSAEEFKATIEVYTYPDEFAACDGSAELVDSGGVYVGQQERKKFAFIYQTKIGNDNGEVGYKIHIIYGCLASPSERSNETINDSPDAMTMSWDVTADPVSEKGFKPTAHVVIDLTKVDSAKSQTIIDALYGTDPESQQEEGTDARLLLPDDIAHILNA